MFGRERKVRRDRGAGMVFDWRRGHGSATRLFFAALISASVWGGLLAYVRVREPIAPEIQDDQIDLTLVDLDDDRNQWLATLIDRETLFQQRWPVEDPSLVAGELARVMSEDSPRNYQPQVREVPRPESIAEVSNLPGRDAGLLPKPDRVESVTLSAPLPNWWIEVKWVDGSKGMKPFAFPFEWPEDPSSMSEGDAWFVVATTNERGTVVSVDGGREKEGDPRTAAILNEIRARGLTGLTGGGEIRIWRLEARLVNRSLSE